MKTKRFQWEYRKSASKGHKLIGEILRESPLFKHHTSFQEYPVNKINTSYPSGKEHYDWVVPALQLVIEFHGEFHTNVIAFNKKDPQAAIDAFKAQKKRDAAKKQAAIDAGWVFLEISYKDKDVTAEKITELYIEGLRTAVKKQFTLELVKAPKKKLPPRKIPAALKARNKELRQKAYQKAKEWKKKHVLQKSSK